jgi:hydrogenase expression/formation protein HypC
MLRPAEPASRCGPEGHCITCGDDGVAMRVTGMDAREDLAICVDDSGDANEVAVDLVGAVAAGDMVLVHAGVAIARLEEAAA